jgi:cytochrome c
VAVSLPTVVIPTLSLVAISLLAWRAVAQDAITPDEEAGADLYNSVCKGCHGVSIAPTLRGVVGRPIASVATFAGYSEGLKAKSSLTWTKENLDVFLTSPADFAPGTQMTQKIPEAQRRADIIAYLESLPPPKEE